MAYKSLSLKITGVSPLILHNGQMANPLNKWTKQLKAISGKRNKTDADFEQMARLEWFGGLYLHNGKPCLPGEVLEAAFINGARKNKRGKQTQAGLMCPDNYLIVYDGPTDLDEMWNDESFRIVSKVKVGQASVMRTRPIFQKWACEFTLMYDDSLLNEREVLDMIRITGEQVGLCDWRPKFGRFTVEQNGKK